MQQYKFWSFHIYNKHVCLATFNYFNGHGDILLAAFSLAANKVNLKLPPNMFQINLLGSQEQSITYLAFLHEYLLLGSTSHLLKKKGRHLPH